MNIIQKKALIVAYWFPPMSVHTWRSWYVYEELKKKFAKVFVITTSHRKYLNHHDRYTTGQKIIAIPTFDHRSFYFFLNKDSAHVAEQKKSRLNFWIYYLLNSFPFNLLIGEGGAIYIFLGWRAALKKVKNGDVSFLFSSYRPYADHCIAWLIKKSHPEIYWVADFRDLHLDPALKETFFPRFQAWCNRRILAKADMVTTVSKGLATHLQPFHSNVVVLRNGIGSSSNIPASTPNQQPTEAFTITYTGSMFRELRKPDLLLEALSALIGAQKMSINQVQIVYAGKDAATWMPLLRQYGLTPIFRPLGNLSHEDALALQSNTHINLLLTYASPALKGNATGKLYEYLAARQPILLLVNGCQDEELEAVFEDTNAGMIAYDSLNHKELVKQFIFEKYVEWQQTGNVSPAISSEKLAGYQWKNMMADFLESHSLILKSNLEQLV